MKSSYVFGAALALGSVSGLIQSAEAASITVAQYTFETSAAGLAATAVTAPTFAYVAEVGSGTGIASHAAVTTVYSSPSGSGSARSLSANNFAAGDYFQFGVSAAALQDLAISFDAVSSNTGPKVFNLAYSTNGASFANFTSYTLNTGTATSFGTSATNSAVNYAFDLSGITALNGSALVAFRLIEADTTTATGGTSRVDNVTISANSAAPVVPEPASLGLAALVVGGLAARRRRA